jgi:HSP20 family protein
MEVRFDNPWGEGLLFDRVHRLFWQLDRSNNEMRPPADVTEDKDAYHFYIEMPGVKNDALEARVENGRLMVAAERIRPEWSSETEVHLAERGYGKISRAFELPKDASYDKIQAGYKDGVLEVTVEKKPESKPAKILIN